MSQKVEDVLKETGAILQGHFLLASGRHSPTYVEKFHILQFANYTEQLCRSIADHFRDNGIGAVAGPTLGGIILAHEVARQLGVQAFYAEREGDRRVFRRGLDITPGTPVLVVDDILTTGGSLREVIEAVRRHKGKVVAAAVLVNRGDQEMDLGVPLFSCLRVSIPTYAPKECPQCKEGTPLTKLGSSLHT